MVAFIDTHRAEHGVEPIGNVPPVELELAYDRQREESARVA